MSLVKVTIPGYLELSQDVRVTGYPGMSPVEVTDYTGNQCLPGDILGLALGIF